MADIATNLQKLVDDRDDIRTVLVTKGVTAASTHGFDDFADDIASIPSGGASESDVQNLVIASKPYYQTKTVTSSTETITSQIYAKNYTTYYYPLYMLKGLMFTIKREHNTSNSFTGYVRADCKVILKSNDTIIATYDLGRFSKYRDRQSIHETITSTFDISNFQEYFASYPNAILYIENTGITPTNPPLSTTVTLSSTEKST